MAQTKQTEDVPFIPSIAIIDEISNRVNLVKDIYPDYTITISKNNVFIADDDKSIQVIIFIDKIECEYPHGNKQHTEKFTIIVSVASVGNHTDDVITKVYTITELVKMYMQSMDFMSSKHKVKLPNTDKEVDLDPNWRDEYTLRSIDSIRNESDYNSAIKTFGTIMTFTTNVVVGHKDYIQHGTKLEFGEVIISTSDKQETI